MENIRGSQYYEQQQCRLPLKKRKYRDELLELETENSNTRLPQYNNTVYQPAQVVRDTENSNNNENDENNSDSDDDDEIGAMIYQTSRTAKARAVATAAACKYAESSDDSSISEEKEEEEWVQCEKLKSGEGCLPR